MEKAIKVVNELQRRGLIRTYAIGEGIATIYYVEPILTYDLDIFFIQPEEEKEIISISAIYDFLETRGYKPHKEHVLIENLRVQFFPAYNELIREAIENAVEVKYKKTKTRIFRAEYLIAIMIQTSRPKDKERMIKILDEAEIEKGYLTKILRKYGLKEKFERFVRLYYYEE